MTAIAGRLLGLLTAALLAGCSLTHFVYNRADSFVVREVGKYLTLTETQEDALRGAVLDWQAWHRQHALPRWQADARALGNDLQAPMDAAAVRAWQARVARHLRAALDQMMLRLVPLIATLSDAQIDAFWASFDTRRQDRRDDAPADVEALKDRAAKWMKPWAGRPNAAQKALIAAWAEPQAWRWSEAGRARQAAEDARQRAGVAALLAARRAPDAVDQWRAYLADDARDAVDLAAEAAWVQLLADLSATLTARQRDRLGRRVAHYADLFARMAAD